MTPWTIAFQAPLFMGFPRQEYWSGCHCLLWEIFLTQGSNLQLLHWQVDSLPLSHQGGQHVCICIDTHTHTHTPTHIYNGILPVHYFLLFIELYDQNSKQFLSPEYFIRPLLFFTLKLLNYITFKNSCHEQFVLSVP